MQMKCFYELCALLSRDLEKTNFRRQEYYEYRSHKRTLQS